MVYSFECPIGCFCSAWEKEARKFDNLFDSYQKYVFKNQVLTFKEKNGEVETVFEITLRACFFYYTLILHTSFK